MSYSNLKNNDAYGVEVSGNLDFRKWWSSNISLDAYKKKVKGTVETTRDNLEFIAVDVTNFNVRMNNNFKVTKDLRLQLSGMYRGRDISLQYIRNVMWKMDFGSSYTILKGNGTISARVTDIFNTMYFSFSADKPFKANGQFRGENQTGYLGFSYRFGSNTIKSLQRKQRDNNETQGGGML